jgi:Na+-translocating ferredoxin:NAD+ oxidoreductase RNF subunit RnfB
MTPFDDQFDVVEKEWPMSVGDGKAQRKKRPRILAITTDCCTGCAGSPACIEYCPIEACMFWVSDEDHHPSDESKSIHTSASVVRSARAKVRTERFSTAVRGMRSK